MGYAPFQGTLTMAVNGVLGFRISQCLRHIRPTEQHLAALLDGANLPELGVGENHQFVHFVLLSFAGGPGLSSPLRRGRMWAVEGR